MIKSIHLKNFRLFDDFSLETSNKLIILSGKNATGKTSILEAIYLCATSKSHRSNTLDSLILNQKEFALCEIDGFQKYKVVISKEGKTLFINKRQISKISDFIGNLSVILFSPYDLSLIQGSKGDKRHFLDLEISLLDKTYLKASTTYKRLLKERNELLRQQNTDKIYLNVLTNSLIEPLKIIYQKRINFIAKLNEFLLDISKQMHVENIKILYNKTYEEDVYKSFQLKEKQDLQTKTTNIGTHRDDFRIYINDFDAMLYASEGQRRTICICIKLALKEYIKFLKKEEPILLLDDVFATLDKTRIENLTKYVLNNRQTFITTTSILEIPDELLKCASVIRIESKKGD